MPKWIIKYTATKTLEENLDDYFYKLGFRKAFWSMIPKPEAIKKKTAISDYIKIYTFSAKQQHKPSKNTNDSNFHFQLWKTSFDQIHSSTENE